jgi:hypothetical protein
VNKFRIRAMDRMGERHACTWVYTTVLNRCNIGLGFLRGIIGRLCEGSNMKPISMEWLSVNGERERLRQVIERLSADWGGLCSARS